MTDFKHDCVFCTTEIDITRWRLERSTCRHIERNASIEIRLGTSTLKKETLYSLQYFFSELSSHRVSQISSQKETVILEADWPTDIKHSPQGKRMFPLSVHRTFLRHTIIPSSLKLLSLYIYIQYKDIFIWPVLFLSFCFLRVVSFESTPHSSLTFISNVLLLSCLRHRPIHETSVGCVASRVRERERELDLIVNMSLCQFVSCYFAIFFLFSPQSHFSLLLFLSFVYIPTCSASIANKEPAT